MQFDSAFKPSVAQCPAAPVFEVEHRSLFTAAERRAFNLAHPSVESRRAAMRAMLPPAEPRRACTGVDLNELREIEQIECALDAELRRPRAPIVSILQLAPASAHLAHIGAVDVAGSDSSVMRPLKREAVLGLVLRADGKIYPLRVCDVEPVFTGNVNTQIAELEAGDAEAARESDALEIAQSARAHREYARRMAALDHELSASEYEAREAARAATN